MTIQEYITKYQGQLVADLNGGYKGECVSLVKQWIAANGWPPKRGNAIDWQMNGDDFYQWVKNTPSGVPVAGDLIVFSYGKYGHIGIVVSGNSNSIDVFNQNYPKGNLTDPAQITRFNYSKVVGWLHPKGTSMPDAGYNYKIPDTLIKDFLVKYDGSDVVYWAVPNPDSFATYLGNHWEWVRKQPYPAIAPALEKQKAQLDTEYGKQLAALQTQLDDSEAKNKELQKKLGEELGKNQTLQESLTECLNRPDTARPSWFKNFIQEIINKLKGK